jgi:hypothetical protein
MKLKETWCQGMRWAEVAQKGEHKLFFANADHIAYGDA